MSRRRRLVRIALWAVAGAVTLFVLAVATALAFPSVLFVALMALSGLAGPAWPAVPDGDAVVRDCRELVDRFAAGEIRNERVAGVLAHTIPPDQWPAHIRALRPLSVYVDHESCSLMISTGGINPAWGFGVYPDPATNPLPGCADPPLCDGRYLWKTEHDGIVKWEGFEG